MTGGVVPLNYTWWTRSTDRILIHSAAMGSSVAVGVPKRIHWATTVVLGVTMNVDYFLAYNACRGIDVRR